MYRLIFDQPAGRKAFTTRASVLLIGRSPECHLRLLDDGIADRQAAVERASDGYYIRDLKSHNGTRINDQPISVQRLATGDIIEMGAVRMKFEIIHPPAAMRRRLGKLQLLAGVVVVALLVGQIILFINIFSVHRSRKMRMATGPEPSSLSQPNAPSDTNTTRTVTIPTNSIQTTKSQSSPPPPVLGRLLRILKTKPTTQGSEVTLIVDVRAGVGERELDAAATSITIQFYRQESGKATPLEPFTFRVPVWENFTIKTFAARFPGASSQLAGYVVRTYYRNQLQDEQITPPGLTAASAAAR
jgi:hypothetical protein